MKQFKFTIFTLICVLVGLQNVYAKPSYSVSTTSSYIEAGSKVTASITLSNVKAWNIKIKSYVYRKNMALKLVKYMGVNTKVVAVPGIGLQQPSLSHRKYDVT